MRPDFVRIRFPGKRLIKRRFTVAVTLFGFSLNGCVSAEHGTVSRVTQDQQGHGTMPIRLGMSQDEVDQLFPDHEHCLVLESSSNLSHGGALSLPGDISILYAVGSKDGRVCLITSADPRVTFGNGVSAGITFAELLRRFPDSEVVYGVPKYGAVVHVGDGIEVCFQTDNEPLDDGDTATWIDLRSDDQVRSCCIPLYSWP